MTSIRKQAEALAKVADDYAADYCSGVDADCGGECTDADLRRVMMAVLKAAHGDTFEPHAPTVKRCMDALRNHTAAQDDALRNAAENILSDCQVTVNHGDGYELNPDEFTRTLRDAGLCVRAEVDAETIDRCAALCDDAAMRATNGIREMAANANGKAIRALKDKP